MDHRLVVDGEKLLADPFGDRPQPRAGSPGQNDALHSRQASDTARGGTPAWCLSPSPSAGAREEARDPG